MSDRRVSPYTEACPIPATPLTPLHLWRMSQQAPAPISSVAALPADFQTLQQVELDILKSLDTAASAVEELAKVDGADRATLERLVTDFLDTVKVRIAVSWEPKQASLLRKCTAAALRAGLYTLLTLDNLIISASTQSPVHAQQQHVASHLFLAAGGAERAALGCRHARQREAVP